MFLLTCIILAPVNKHFAGLPTPWNSSDPNVPELMFGRDYYLQEDFWLADTGDDEVHKHDISYLWAYLVFTYVFTGLIIYFMRRETLRIIRIRQHYLGSQSTITDRTFKLSGIPRELRSEDSIKQFIEKLEIGKVESVTICRNWKKLDELMDKRTYALRKLEEAWTVHIGWQQKSINAPVETTHSEIQDGDEEREQHEGDGLLGENHITAYENPRPTTRLWYGLLNLQSRKVDAIDYYEEKLRKLDESIKETRKTEFETTPLAFVTMDSIPACQMAVQAILDPLPRVLLAKLSPAPSDIVWPNTYLSRSSRMVRSWTITILILILTIFWLIPVLALAGLLDLCTIQQVWPQLAKFLESHEILKALVQTGLPTLVVSLLNVAVPFLYDYLANMQGMISQGDVELSVISKNFFFTFFNVFLIFTVGGSLSRFWPILQKSVTDNTVIAYELARSVRGLGTFYINFILLQSLGLLPFRLLEFGSMYPIPLFSKSCDNKVPLTSSESPKP